jgi:hypothetical protein
MEKIGFKMKSSYIIESINNILNEDKFSKYNLQQIYDELGEEDCIEYLQSLCNKIVKSNFSGFSTVIKNEGLDRIYLLYRKKRSGYVEDIVIWIDLHRVKITITSRLSSGSVVTDGDFVEVISSEDVNISKYIERGIVSGYNSKNLVAIRNELDSPPQDYSTLTLEQLFAKGPGLGMKKFFRECCEEALKNNYTPIQDSGIDLRTVEADFNQGTTTYLQKTRPRKLRPLGITSVMEAFEVTVVFRHYQPSHIRIGYEFEFTPTNKKFKDGTLITNHVDRGRTILGNQKFIKKLINTALKQMLSDPETTLVKNDYLKVLNGGII